jgi:hypothetical protein
MRLQSVCPILMIGVAVLISVHVVDAADQIDANEQSVFFSDLQSWVKRSLLSTGDDQARYILQRIGCPTKSGTKKSEKTVNNKDPIVPSIEDDITQCERMKTDFFCLTTLQLVRDLGIVENKYYYYCQNAKK